MEQILRTHGQRVEAFLRRSCPDFVPGWTLGTTSFRSIEELGRKLPPRSSNELVHIDAGAYGATNGARIFRFFVNIHPTRDRVWGTKGSFSAVMRRHPRALGRGEGRQAARGASTKGPLDKLYSGLIGAVGKLYPLVRVIDSSPYDRSMRRIHNFMKENPSFRDNPEGYQEIHFPPMSAWMVFTDGISHSVLTGQHALVTTGLSRSRTAESRSSRRTRCSRARRLESAAVANLHFTQNLARHTECPSAALPADTVAELLERYFERWPGVRGYVLDDQGEVRHHVKVLVDGRNLHDRRKLTDRINRRQRSLCFSGSFGRLTMAQPAARRHAQRSVHRSAAAAATGASSAPSCSATR